MINLPGGAVVVMFVAVADSLDSGCVGGAVVVSFTFGVDTVDSTSIAGDVNEHDHDDNNNKYICNINDR